VTAAPIGARVRLVARKWPDAPHWERDAVVLGGDRHGTWLGVPVGTTTSRPGAAYRTDTPEVVLVPDGSPYVATFYGPGRVPVAVYVDISTVPRWDGSTVTAVDLDLDVVRGRHGRVWVDDEDEFAVHRVSLGYPDEVVRLASTSCEEVRRAVAEGTGPFAPGVADAWLALPLPGR